MEVQPEGFGETDRMDDMLVDLAGGHPPLDEETPTGFAEAFYRMAVSADERVHDQTLHSRLSTVARLLAIKSQYNLSVACYDNYVGLVHELLPPNSKIPQDFYRSKKLLEGLGMQYHKIDVCEKNCMLYYKDNKNKDTCDICGTSRYKDGSNKVPRKVLRYLPSARDISNLRLNGWKGTRGRNRGPNFFDWFKNICAIRSSVHNVLRQISYGFRKRVSSYGCYDVNGYRFRSEKYESKRAGLATTNSGVCVTCTDDNGNALEYFGVIEDIIKISWEGREQLDLVLFYCRWFDPTSRGVKRTENLGLVEVKHSSRLQNFEPFVLASQVTQVYYLSYASDDPSLKDWWVVYHVAPRDRLPPIDINNDSIETEGPTNDISFFQEDGLEGTFVIDLGDIELIDTLASDEITDPKELEQLEKQTVAPEQEEILESDEEGDEDDAESYDEDCYEEEDF
ncbi:unnamed protein product [Miscanthus lutarioriparius]|uniref:DUF4216 domain-containing protein n=1 Tax=Miscanthus lutarioriparius TaxID=422564 RepID=A0A811R7B7_9POAL|nr:unnamed protein product [Miscanthus lutarioriparius]